ncbi:MAG: hypothetical protein M1480_08155 [Bacteroidetes bacterium]|nr:hypothetical protein [Bacteroidota bacterium]
MRTIFFLFLIVIQFNLFAQSNEVTKVEVKINTYSSSCIYYYIFFRDKMDEDKTFQDITKYKVELVRLTDGTKVDSTTCKIGINPNSISFSVNLINSNKELIEKIFSKDFPTYLSVSEPVIIYMPGGKEPFVLTQDKLKELTLSTKNLTDDQKQILINNINQNAPEFRNKISFSKSVNGSDSTQNEYIAEFDIQKPFLSDLTGSYFYYKIKGRVSTFEQNPLNSIEAYIIYNIQDHLYFEAGRIGPQKFDVNSLRANLGYETLIPNLIDLTGGKPRFRLKPDIKFGLAYQQNFQSNNPFENKEGNLLLFANGYYYIPVLDKFAIIAEGEARYSDKFYNGDKFIFNYSLTFGYETPLNDLKVLFQVINGKNEVNLGGATSYSLGLLLNFIPF